MASITFAAERPSGDAAATAQRPPLARWRRHIVQPRRRVIDDQIGKTGYVGFPASSPTTSCHARDAPPTLVVRRRIVSCHGRSSPSGKNSDRNRQAQRYSSQAPIFANVRAYSGVHRSGMSSDAGQSVDRAVTAHRQGLKPGSGTSTVLNSEFDRRVRVSFRPRRCRQRGRRRRTTQYSATRA